MSLDDVLCQKLRASTVLEFRDHNQILQNSMQQGTNCIQVAYNRGILDLFYLKQGSSREADHILPAICNRPYTNSVETNLLVRTPMLSANTDLHLFTNPGKGQDLPRPS